MLETVIASTKIKALLIVFGLIVLGGIYSSSMNNNDGSFTTSQNENVEPFTKDIQMRSDQVQNAVNEVINQQGKQPALTYKRTCESSMGTIRSERLSTEHNCNTLPDSQKELIQNYRAYLKEQAEVVSNCYAGQKPDLTAMNEAKTALY